MSPDHDQLPIIQTKFCAPRITSGLVSRDRLLSLLDGSLEVPLTLVSAPAGYGKSVLVSQWLEQQEHRTLWLSLDAADSDLRQFLSYFVAIFQKVFPEAFTATEGLLNVPEELPPQVLASYLLNDLDELDGPCSIVLDDYHCLSHSSGVHELLNLVMQHPPSQVHFVLISRRDPALPLTKLRALNQLLEIRMQDLQFNRAEIRALLITANDFAPSDDALANLQQEMEGWAVGLHLVSLALRHNHNPEEFLKSLQGGIPQSQEYLLSEVLSGLPPEFREYLLRCSLLNRFCAELVEYVSSDYTADSGLSGTDFIRQLTQDNLFTMCLDDQNQWFRFHHLFRDLLQGELKRSVATGELEEIHMRASQWCESRAFVEAAIHHALEAGDAAFAARIIERHCYDNLEEDRWFLLNRWLNHIPREVKRERPVLLLVHAWVAAFGQQHTTVAALVEELEPLLREQEGRETLQAEVDFFRGYLLFWGGEFDQAARLLKRAQSHIARHKNMLIAEADLHLAIVLYLNGQAGSAHRMIDKQIGEFGGLQLARRLGALAFIDMLAGDLDALEINARRMRMIDQKMRTPLTDGWSVYFSGCAELHRFQPEAAAKSFSRVVSRPHVVDRRAAIDAFAGLALAQQLSGQADAAATTIDKFTAFVSESDEPENLALVNACEARIGLLQGKAAPLLRGQQSPTGVFDLFLWIEAPAITRVRQLVAEGSETNLGEAQQLLDEIRNISETCHFNGQLIEIAVLQSLVFATQGRDNAALETLEQALALAQPGGWLRPFIELGSPMAKLLSSLRDKSDHFEFINHLLTTFDTTRTGIKNNKAQPPSAARMADPEPDGLTNRELDILELLTQRLQNKEIARQLFISTHTVKDHLKHIYQKLGVSNRRQAVSRAEDIGIIHSR